MILIGSFENVCIGTKTPKGQSCMRSVAGKGTKRIIINNYIKVTYLWYRISLKKICHLWWLSVKTFRRTVVEAGVAPALLRGGKGFLSAEPACDGTGKNFSSIWFAMGGGRERRKFVTTSNNLYRVTVESIAHERDKIVNSENSIKLYNSLA